ncbi:mechanosensitive ion channel domain-containing protein, partial [Streptococcus pneumoniae]
DIFSIVAGLGIAGLAVGWASQSTLANFIAGVVILVEQSFQVGDWIRLGEKEGRVVKISLRATQILDRDNI